MMELTYHEPGSDYEHKVEAGSLSHNDIGRGIGFVAKSKSSMITVAVDAELRQVYHVGGTTTISITGHDCETGDLEEITLDPGHLIRISDGPVKRA